MRLEGKVIKGRLVVTPPEAWPIAMREYDGKAVVIEVEPKRDRRSTQANARYWGLLVPLAQHCLNLKRPGLLPLNKDQVHALLVSAFVGTEVTELGPVPVRTRSMDTAQFHHLTEQVSLWLQEQNYSIPDGPEATVAELIAEATA